MTLAPLRSHFPALERRHNGYRIAYFDGPGGTQVPRQVVEAMNDYLLCHNANTHWCFPTSVETDAALAAAREALGDLLNGAPSEIVFGANMTTLTFHVARALARGWREGDEILVTELDHHANVDPWKACARERDLIVRTARVDTKTWELDWDHLAAQLSSRTKLVAIGAASNALGTVNDIDRAVKLAREVGALVFVDAVHYAPHHLVDVRAWDCDFLACSAYKFHGPHVGVLYGRRDLLASLDVPKLQPAPDAAPERVETGTLNHEGIVGAGAAVDFLASIEPGSGDRRQRGARRQALQTSYERLHEAGQTLVTRLWTGLSSIPGVRLYGRPPDQLRTPTVAFAVNGHSADAVAYALGRHGVFVSHGDFYASTLIARLAPGQGGLVRAGCACYTTDEEVDRLVHAVGAISSASVSLRSG
jgi:cysteine desulfurase family protein (TIGR01976 family)